MNTTRTLRRLLAVLALAATVSAAAAPGSHAGAADSAGGASGARQNDERTRPHKRQPDEPEVSRTGKGLPPAAQAATPNIERIVDDVVPTPDPNGDEEVETGESKNAYSNMLLVNHGGYTQSAPRIYLVLWGPTWSTSVGDPNGVANRIHYFYQGVGGSSYANVLKEYGSAAGTFTNPTEQYKGYLRDPSPVPAKPTEADMAAAAVRAANLMKDHSYNAQYVIATPWGVVDQKSTAKSFCAWHHYTWTTSSTWVTYTAMPYIPYLDALGRGCGKGWVNGANGLLDGVTILASHEYTETVSDPGLNAWYDAEGDENADKCSWLNLRNYQLANGYSFPVQPHWSNRLRNTAPAFNGCGYT